MGRKVVHARAADDFETIRARIDDLRREREQAAVRQTKRGAVERVHPPNSDPIVISLRWLRNRIGYRCKVPMNLPYQQQRDHDGGESAKGGTVVATGPVVTL